jgi:hypothetical protein
VQSVTSVTKFSPPIKINYVKFVMCPNLRFPLLPLSRLHLQAAPDSPATAPHSHQPHFPTTRQLILLFRVGFFFIFSTGITIGFARSHGDAHSHHYRLLNDGSETSSDLGV